MSFLSLARVSIVGTALALLALCAPTVGAQGPSPSGSYTITFYNYISDEGGAACPTSGGIPGGSEGALNTFHFWREGTAPYPGVNVSQYTVCWTGTLNFPSTGNWTVQTVNDDGMDIWVDGQIAMRAWYDQGPSLHTGSIYIDSSVAHQVIIKYYNDTLGGTACVGWGPTGGSIGYWNCPNPYGPAYVQQPYTVASTYPFGQPNPYSYPQPNGQPNPYSYPQPNGQTYPYYYPQPNGQTVPYYYPQPNGQPYPYTYPQPQTVQPYPQYYVPRYGGGYSCIYIVRPGDFLVAIAARYGVNYYYIAQVNRLYNPNLIYTGMRLVIPNCR